jgi:hypothetical protein
MGLEDEEDHMRVGIGAERHYRRLAKVAQVENRLVGAPKD